MTEHEERIAALDRAAAASNRAYRTSVVVLCLIGATLVSNAVILVMLVNR